MLFLYRVITNLIIIFSPIIVLIRLLKKKEHPIRFLEKFCKFSKKRGTGKLIWFHGASVGEILSIIPLIEKLEKDKDIKRILITSTTLSSSYIISKLKLKKTIHQFYPLDTNFLTKKFLSYWKPSLAIFVESEIWPNMISNLKKELIPHILLNARITKKSFTRWKMMPSFSKKLFKSFIFCYPQNQDSKKFLKLLGVEKIKYIGNLKFSENEKKSKKTNNRLDKFLKDRKFWCASSTHEGEEITAALTHLDLQKKYNKLVTIIIPRHIQRVEKIKNSIQKLGLKVHKHSSLKKINPKTNIYLVDTYGETKSFFRICKTVFLGGSLINHGGQNPIEAARFGCKVIHGPNINNFKEIYDLLEKNSLTTKIKNRNDLTKVVNKLFNSKLKSLNLIKKIKQLGDSILNDTTLEINTLIKKNEIKKTKILGL